MGQTIFLTNIHPVIVYSALDGLDTLLFDLQVAVCKFPVCACAALCLVFAWELRFTRDATGEETSVATGSYVQTGSTVFGVLLMGMIVVHVLVSMQTDKDSLQGMEDG